MNYETKYKQALYRARNFCERWDGLDVDSSSLVIKDVKKIFPELAESEDERMRKAIHIYLDWLDGRKDYQPKGDYTIRDMIDWLEKQGERRSLDPDKVIAWLVDNICDFDEYHVNLFKKEFGL